MAPLGVIGSSAVGESLRRRAPYANLPSHKPVLKKNPLRDVPVDPVELARWSWTGVLMDRVAT